MIVLAVWALPGEPRMPGVVGQAPEAAASLLRGAGIARWRVLECLDPRVGRVIAQSPAASTLLAPDSRPPLIYVGAEPPRRVALVSAPPPPPAGAPLRWPLFLAWQVVLGALARVAYRRWRRGEA